MAVNTDLSALRALWKQAFGDSDAYLDTFFRTAYSPARCRTREQDGQLAAMLFWFDCTCGGNRLAYLYAVATDKHMRGQGLCHALMAETHAHLANLGYAGTLLCPESEALFSFYAGMGYRPCCSVRTFPCAPGAEPVPMHRIDAAEYARLRRTFLPAGGVVQEGENLALLAATVTLYAGQGFLLAAKRNGDSLTGVELLGDAECAPGIVRALGCAVGSFRTPGTGTPFAMFRPLASVPAPSYFGLAFD